MHISERQLKEEFVKKIALEEHFVTPDLVGYGSGTSAIAQPDAWANASRRLLDFTEERLPEMDAYGLDIEVLSLNSPGIQAETDAATAVAKATTVNDFLAGLIAEHPTRFSGFAALPLQDPKAAADELERAVTQLGLKGGLTYRIYFAIVHYGFAFGLIKLHGNGNMCGIQQSYHRQIVNFFNQVKE